MKKKLLMGLLGVGIGIGSIGTVSADDTLACKMALGDCFGDFNLPKYYCLAQFRKCMNN